jgi:hypothetical protein
MVLNARCLNQQVINRCHQAALASSGLNHGAALSLKGSAVETAFMWEPQRCDYSLKRWNVSIKGVGKSCETTSDQCACAIITICAINNNYAK